MRALTPAEVRELELSRPDVQSEIVCWDIVATLRMLESLRRRGLIRVWRASDGTVSETTPQGLLALRVHREFLASTGSPQ